MISAKRLREVLSYDPETGVFLWKEKIASKVVVGRVAGNVGNYGYIYIRIQGKLYYGHRLAWLYVYGVWPENGIDHRNGVPADNRIENLRPANQSENNQNMRLPKHNKSGLMGVSFNNAARKWAAQIKHHGRNRQLGTFATPEAAHAAYLKAKAELHTFQPTPRDAT